MNEPKKILVIGGGVIGAFSAWELSKAGCDVTIVEKGRFGAACSHGNCGYISPSHVLPLAQPGTVAKTLKSMLKPNSPFAVKPRLSLTALRWFWKFMRRCNLRDMMASAAAIHSLLQSSKSLYQQLIADEGIECEWQERGCLFVHESQHEFDKFAETEKLIREHFGVAGTRHSRDELIQLEPAIKPIVAGGWHYEDDCHLRPDKLMTEIRNRLETHGVQIIENMEIQSLVRVNEKVRVAVSADGEWSADHFVVATGSWTPFLNRELGCRIPIQPGKGYSLTMPNPKNGPKIPIIFEDTHVAITPMDSKYRIGSTMEFVGYDMSIHPRRLGLLRASAERYLHDPHCEPIEEEWFGWRPMTWDSRPVISQSPVLKNVWINAGHSMLGISTATGSGRLIREMILGEEAHIDARPFSVRRFG